MAEVTRVRAANRRHALGRCFVLVFAIGALAACSDSKPTTLLVEISQTKAVGSLDELRLSVFSPQGLELPRRRLPAEGAPTLPSAVVLYPPEAGDLRLLLLGKRKGVIVAEAATEVVAVDHAQTRATLMLKAGRLPDLDGDGVPDTIDDCPKVADPTQTAPCQGGDAAADAPQDAGADLPVQDSVVDALPRDMMILPDFIRHCTSYEECDDGEPCTEDYCQNGICAYGFTVCSYSGDPCHHVPYCKLGVGCVEVPMPDGTPCPDKLYCTTHETCQSGVCTTRPRSCPDDTTGCLLGTCDETHQRCTTKPAPVNTACSRGQFCVVNETCNSSGVCGGGQPRDCQTSAPVCSSGTCDEIHDRCNYSAVAPGTACDDQDTCTQGDVCSSSGFKIVCAAPKNTAITLDSDNMLARGARSVVVDSKGAVHAIYSEHHTINAIDYFSLRYTSNASGSWKTSILVGPSKEEVGMTPSLAIDPQDRLHAVYRNRDELVYRHWKVGTPWPPSVETVDKPTTRDSAIVVDSKGWVHVAHSANGSLRYATRAPGGTGGWSHSTAYKPSTASDNTAMMDIALDAGGHVHIAHGNATTPDYYSNRLWHTSNETGQWDTSLVNGSKGAGHLPSIIIDGHGTISIAHGIITATSSPGSLLIETRSSSPTASWMHRTLASSQTHPYGFPTLILGANNHLHVVYQDFSKAELLHLTNAKGSWTASTTTIDTGTFGRWASAARGPNGRFHVIYEGTAHGPVRYASFSACQ